MEISYASFKVKLETPKAPPPPPPPLYYDYYFFFFFFFCSSSTLLPLGFGRRRGLLSSSFVTPAPRKTRKRKEREKEMKSARATLLPLLSSYAVMVGGIRTVCGTVRALQWAFMGGGGGGAWCFFYGPTLPYPPLYHFDLLTYLPSFL